MRTLSEQSHRGKRRRRRWFLGSVLALAGLLLAAFLVWPYLIPTAWIEAAVQAAADRFLERPLDVGQVRLTRLGHIRLEDSVIWQDPSRSAPLLRWKSFDLAVKLWPLLRGELEVERITLIRPEAFVPLSEEGRPLVDLPRVAGPVVAGLAVAEAAVRQGTLTFLNPDSTPRLTLRRIQARGRLESLRGPLRFSLSLQAPDSQDEASISLEGKLALAEEAREIGWEALRGFLKLTLKGFDWQAEATPSELKEALIHLPVKLLRQTKIELAVRRDRADQIDVEGSFSSEALKVLAREGEPLELEKVALEAEGLYRLDAQAVEVRSLHLSAPWIESELSGRLDSIRAPSAWRAKARGRLRLDALPSSFRSLLAGQGLSGQGELYWEASLSSDPGRLALQGSLDLESAGLRLAESQIKPPGEPARLTVDVERADSRWTIHQLWLDLPGLRGRLAGMVRWRPPESPSVHLRLTGQLRPEEVASRWPAIQASLPPGLVVAGALRAEATVRGILGGLTIAGRLDATDTMVALNGMGIKDRGEKAALEAELELKKQTLVIRKLDVGFPVGRASIRGKVPLQAGRRRYSLRASARLDVDKLQRHLGGEVIWLPPGLTVSGFLEARARASRFQRTLEVEADLDARALSIHWGLDGAKPAGVPARIQLAGRLERGMDIERLTLEVGPALVHLAGRLARGWSRASLRYEASVQDLAGLESLWRPLARASPRGALAARGTLEWEKGKTALNGSVEFHSASIRLEGQKPLTLALQGTISHSPTSLSTEKLHLSVDGQPVVITAALERDRPAPKLLALVEAGRLDLSALKDLLKAPGGGPPPDWQEALVSSIRQGGLIHARLRAQALRLDGYNLEDLQAEVRASEGVVRVPRFDFGLNGGQTHHSLSVDMKGPEPSLEATIQWQGLGADPNLRPFLDFVFPNLFVTGSLDFSARYQAVGADADRINETLRGTSTMKVHKGYLVSDPTPEATRQVFPTLTMSHYSFDRGLIETRTQQGRSYNVMHFEAPTVNLILRGWTDNRTREIEYVMVVDLVENLGLGAVRDKIPDFLESASQVEIATIRGTLDDQRVEYLKPRVEKIKNTLKALLTLKPLQKLLKGMSDEEKAGYLKGKVGGLLGAATKPFRYLTRRLTGP